MWRRISQVVIIILEKSLKCIYYFFKGGLSFFFLSCLLFFFFSFWGLILSWDLAVHLVHFFLAWFIVLVFFWAGGLESMFCTLIKNNIGSYKRSLTVHKPMNTKYSDVRKEKEKEKTHKITKERKAERKALVAMAGMETGKLTRWHWGTPATAPSSQVTLCLVAISSP